MRLSGKLVLMALVAVSAVIATAAVSAGAGNVSLSKPLIKRNGTAVLPVTVSAPGHIVLWDAETLRPCGGPPRIQRKEVDVQNPETLRLTVKPTSLIKPSLKQGRRVKVPVEVDFTPAGANVNAPEAHVIRIALRMRAKGTAAAIRRCGPTPPTP